MPYTAHTPSLNHSHTVMNEAILRLHSQLDIGDLLEEFARWTATSVDFSAVHYRHPTLGLFEFTFEAPTETAYECSHHQLGDLGILYFLHDSPYPSVEQTVLTECVDALRLPLNNAVRYQSAVRQCDSLTQRLRLSEQTCTSLSVVDTSTQLQGLDELVGNGELHHALSNDALTVFYQPKIDLKSGRVSGVEALLRWYHAEQGLLSPEQFIPLAEHNGLIQTITRWVLNAVLRQCALWQQQGLLVPVAVNLSGIDLQDESLPDYLSQLLQAWEIPADYLELEITETAAISDMNSSIDTLHRISALGITIAIDDFGIGHSSLHRLKHLPVHIIKIDKSFIMGQQQGDRDLLFVDTIAQLGHQLGMKVIAEGVDSHECWQQLQKTECDMAQGYHISHPLSGEAITGWLCNSANPSSALHLH